MNPNRTSSYLVRECLRLASYLADGTRLYSNEEIAGRLGETPKWVAAVLGAYSGYASPPRIVDACNHRTNMTYDPGKG